MSADVIQAKYDMLEKIAAGFGKSHTDTLRLQQHVTRSFKALEEGGWQGRGASAFFAEMHGELFPAMKRLAQAMETARTVTLEAKKIMETAEKEAAAPFKLTAVDLVKQNLNNAISGPGTDEAAIKQIIDNASDAERKAIAADPALMAKLRDELGDQKYLDTVVQLRMFQSGSVAHTTAAKADSAIQSHLESYLEQAIKDGRKVSGSVAVVGDTDWNIAGEAHYGKAVWDSQKKDNLNGFVDAQGRVWIHKDRGNPGTMIHEAVHKYAKDTMINTSQPLNEGVTEYFTRSVGKSTTPPIPARGNYQSNHSFVQSLVGLVGEQTVAKAYFDGDMNGLRDAYIKAGKTQADWDKMIEHTKKDEWSDAKRLARK